jgi:hypothetical protein
MKLFRPTTILLVLLLAAMVMVPIVSAATDNIATEKIKTDANFVSIEKATSVANTYVKLFSNSFTDYSDWKGATVRKVTTYYDLNGKESAYSFDVLTNGQYNGYLIVSATKDNYPVREFSKGLTPDRETSTIQKVQELASAEAKKQKVTLGTPRPIYLGATFYYTGYPVNGRRISSGTIPQNNEDMIIIDLHDKSIIRSKENIQSPAGIPGAPANSVPNEKTLSTHQQQYKQDANAAWTALENYSNDQKTASLQSAKSAFCSVAQQNLQGGIYFNDNNAVGCAPESAGMVLGYYRDMNNYNQFSAHNVLPRELATAMYTTPVWYDSNGNIQGGLTDRGKIEPGIDQITAKYHYQFNTISNWLYSYNSGKSEINQNHPYILGMMAGGFLSGHFYGMEHDVTARGYREVTCGGYSIPLPFFRYIIVNDAQGRANVNIVDGDWIYAYQIFVYPTAPPTPRIVALCPAGTGFDATAYPQDTPQSNPMYTSCSWDGNGRVYVSGSSTDLVGVHADDGFTVDTPKGVQFDAEGHYAHQHAPLDITDGMNVGSNSLTIIVRNYQGLSMSYGSSTGIGVDQTPYIIEVNDPTLIAAAQSKMAKAVAFVPNSTSLKGSIPTETLSVTTNSTVSNG